MRVLANKIFFIALLYILQACQSTENIWPTTNTQNNALYVSDTFWFKNYSFNIQQDYGVLTYQQSSKLSQQNPSISISLQRNYSQNKYLEFQDSDGKITVKIVKPNKAILQLDKARYNLWLSNKANKVPVQDTAMSFESFLETLPPK